MKLPDLLAHASPARSRAMLRQIERNGPPSTFADVEALEAEDFNWRMAESRKSKPKPRRRRKTTKGTS